METRKNIQFFAEMTCQGCCGAVTKILEKIPGVADIQCSVPDQRVSITADNSIDPNSVLERLQVWGNASGKRVSLAN
jgi:copper chaperone CopZ